LTVTLVRYDIANSVATLTLDSPANRNALSMPLVSELTDELRRAADDPTVRAVRLTHTGRVFCAGADLTAAGTGSMTDSTTAITALLTAIVTTPKPVIAQVAGHVRAGGMGILGACDLAVATETASFAFSEARIGVAPAIISLTTLDVLDPRAVARYYLTGETFDTPEAARLGLITVAATTDTVDELIGDLFEQIRQTSPQGSAETKQLLTAERRARLARNAEAMARLSARLFASPEAQEGIRAFREKRLPAWCAASQ
jgi:enoyl-CoA hydratase